MPYRTLVSIAGIVTDLLTMAVAAVAFLTATLAAGPVSLPFAIAIIEHRLADTFQSFQWDAEGVQLTWARMADDPHLVIDGITLQQEAAARSARIEQVAIALDSARLLDGHVAVAGVSVLSPTLDATLPTPRVGETADRSGPAGSLAGVIQGLLRFPGGGADDFLATQALLQVSDGRVNLAPAAGEPPVTVILDHVVIRRDQGQLGGDAVLSAATPSGTPMTLTLDLASGGETGLPALSAKFDRFVPAFLAPFADNTPELAGIQVPITGMASLTVTREGAVDTLVFDLSAGSGTISIPKSAIDPANDAAEPVKLALASAAFAGNWNAAVGRRLTVDRAAARFAPGTVVPLPPPIDHAMPFLSFSGRGTWDEATGRAAIAGVVLDLDGPTVTLDGTVGGTGDADAGSITAVVRGLAADRLPVYWPKALAPGGRDWSVTHLSAGVVPEATATIRLARDNGALTVGDVSMDMQVRGLTLDYFPPLPPVRDIVGTGTFVQNRLTFTVSHGVCNGLSVAGARIDFPDIGAPIEHIVIDVDIDGPLSRALDLLDRKPLQFISGMGLSPASVKGHSDIRLTLRMPLLNDLRVDQIELVADSRITDGSIPDIALGKSLTDIAMDLHVTTAGMRATGNAKFADVPASFVWSEQFKGGPGPKLNVDVAIHDVPADDIRTLGVPVVVEAADIVEGPVSATINLKGDPAAQNTIAAHIDLSKSAFTIPVLGFHKAAGRPAVLSLTLQRDGSETVKITPITVTGDAMAAAGDVIMAPDGGVSSVNLDFLRFGGTDVSGSVLRMPGGGWDVSLSGPQLDLSPFRNRMEHSDSESGTQTSGAPGADLSINLDFDRVRTGDGIIENVTATLVREDDVWRLIQVMGTLSGGDPIEVLVLPGADNGRDLSITAHDGGGALRALGLFDNIVGGKLDITGRFDDSRPGIRLSGVVRMGHYRLVRAPILARILDVLAVTGIVNSLSGPGIAFSSLNVPFSFDGSTIEITNGRTHGLSLGLTTSGTVDLDQQTMNLRGSVVPFFAINSALSNIPLLGDLLTGTEPGSGIFAASYQLSGDMDNPDLQVNPLSIIAPGILRELLEFLSQLFTGGEPSVSINGE